MKLLILAILVVSVLECASKETKDKKKAKDTKTKLPKIKEKKMFNFVGKDHWSLPALAHCFKEPKLPNDYFCYKYYRNYEVVYIDPVATIPIILVYRNFIPQKFLDDFLRDVKKKQKSNQQKGIDDMGFMRSYLNTFKKRVANSTTISHTEMSGVARVFRRAQSLIPMLNFSISSPWEVRARRPQINSNAFRQVALFMQNAQLKKEENMFAYDIEKLIAPNMKAYGISPFYDVYAIRQLIAEEYARMNAEMPRKKG
ncbi:unnamed protein product [Haemonchus placei]|uniref:Uncharacterized protein n=1 Tax=Haemonchus placei TaxID=6290 RepID=A0A0N4WYX3_HAEPC|nr:unnamed protein product [Haemonchus placei]